MRIVNRTPYRTPDLRAILERVARVELEPDHARRAVVTVIPGRRPGWLAADSGTGCSGHASLGGTHATIRIDIVHPDPLDFAFVAAHEMAHLRGWGHDLMRGTTRYRRRGNYRDLYAWAAAMPIAVRPPRPARPRRPAPDPRAVRLAHAAAMVRAWTTRARRADTMLRKWRRIHGARARAMARGVAPGVPAASDPQDAAAAV